MTIQWVHGDYTCTFARLSKSTMLTLSLKPTSAAAVGFELVMWPTRSKPISSTHVHRNLHAVAKQHAIVGVVAHGGRAAHGTWRVGSTPNHVDCLALLALSLDKPFGAATPLATVSGRQWQQQWQLTCLLDIVLFR